MNTFSVCVVHRLGYAYSVNRNTFQEALAVYNGLEDKAWLYKGLFETGALNRHAMKGEVRQDGRDMAETVADCEQGALI